jgi:ADP-ribose pyrophosphatase YjhB (NUDIX family)
MGVDREPRFKIGVFGLILDQDKVLMCHRRDVDLWNLPGGILEPGETPWAGVVREVCEETTLEVQACRLIGVYARPDQAEVAFGFLCEIVSGTPQCTDEADAIGYYPIDHLPPNTNHEQAEAVHGFDSRRCEAVLCVQPGPSPLQLLKIAELERKICPTT